VVGCDSHQCEHDTGGEEVRQRITVSFMTPFTARTLRGRCGQRGAVAGRLAAGIATSDL
jgi:hypothetical protein